MILGIFAAEKRKLTQMGMDNFDAYFHKQQGDVRAVALALRALLDSHHALTTALAWNFPCWTGNERIASILAHTDRCNLQLFYGSRLADRWPKRIDGTGKQMRHVKVRSVAEVDDELAEIVAAAVELDVTAPEKVR